MQARQRADDRKLTKKMAADVLRLEQRVLKRERQQELDIAVAERELTKYLPLNCLGEEVDYLFTDPVTRRAISAYIWTHMEAKGKTDPSINELARLAIDLCFSSYLRAHMYITSSKDVKQ